MNIENLDDYSPEKLLEIMFKYLYFPVTLSMMNYESIMPDLVK